MTTKVFSVYDSKACVFGNPFVMVTVGAAIRAFTELCNDPQTMVYRHPSDFVLYEIGSFEDSKGVLIELQPHNHLGLASDYKEQKPVVYNPAGSVDKFIKEAVSNPLSTTEELANGK